MAKLEAEQVVIANGASASNAIDLRSRVLRVIILPTAWTAADLAYSICDTETGTYVPFNDWDGVPWANTAVASSATTLRQEAGEAVGFLKVLSVSTADNTVAVNQGAARTLTLLTEQKPN